MSSFYSPEGIQVEAPVFHALPRLPTPIGSFLYTSPYFRFVQTPHLLFSLYPRLGVLGKYLTSLYSATSFEIVRPWSSLLSLSLYFKYVHGLRNLPVADRLTALPLLQALLEFDTVRSSQTGAFLVDQLFRTCNFRYNQICNASIRGAIVGAKTKNENYIVL